MQRPFEVVDPKKLSVNNLENYFLVLLAMEVNMKEYMRLKTDLQDCYKEACEYNVPPEDILTALKPSVLSRLDEQDEDYENGDVMTAMITGNVSDAKKLNKMVGEDIFSMSEVGLGVRQSSKMTNESTKKGMNLLMKESEQTVLNTAVPYSFTGSSKKNLAMSANLSSRRSQHHVLTKADEKGATGEKSPSFTGAKGSALEANKILESAQPLGSGHARGSGGAPSAMGRKSDDVKAIRKTNSLTDEAGHKVPIVAGATIGSKRSHSNGEGVVSNKLPTSGIAFGGGTFGSSAAKRDSIKRRKSNRSGKIEH
jgi:hypothetical protein